MEFSVINFTRTQSLEEERKDTNSTFRRISIPIETKPNNGIVSEYYNKCFFISLCDGLKQFNLPKYGIFDTICPLALVLVCNQDHNEMIDTFKKDDKIIINWLAKVLDIKIEVHIGQLINNVWMTTPDPSFEFGNGKVVIKILNKGAHFELITTNHSNFIYQPRRIEDEYIRQQNEIQEKIIQEKRDREFAKLVANGFYD